MNRNKLYIGFITYGNATAKYLPYFLSSLKHQTTGDFKIIAVDNTETEINENSAFIKSSYPEVSLYWAGENLGFAKAYNIMIGKAVEQGAMYFLMLNPDMILETDAVGKMLVAIEGDDGPGAVCPKILRWNYDPEMNIPLTPTSKTKIIDSCGIKLLSGLRFVDIGQGKNDNGQLDKGEILGPSGAAGLFRISALKQIASGGQYFDEMMFMYKEDCDLAYRLHLAGFKTELASEAVLYHARTASALGESNMAIALNRINKRRQLKAWSLKNQLIIFYKYWSIQNWINKLAIIWQLCKIIGFIILFEPYLVDTIFEFLKTKNKINKFKSV